MLYTILVSRDITQSCLFKVEANSEDEATSKFYTLMRQDKVWTQVHNELDGCDTNASDLEVVDVWTYEPDTSEQDVATNLDTL